MVAAGELVSVSEVAKEIEGQEVWLSHWVVDNRAFFPSQAQTEMTFVFDLVWPMGVQEELSQPVAVLLNESTATVALASEVGFRCFTSMQGFRTYLCAMKFWRRPMHEADA